MSNMTVNIQYHVNLTLSNNEITKILYLLYLIRKWRINYLQKIRYI